VGVGWTTFLARPCVRLLLAPLNCPEPIPFGFWVAIIIKPICMLPRPPAPRAVELVVVVVELVVELEVVVEVAAVVPRLDDAFGIRLP
jgi:hypothetical protein